MILSFQAGAPASATPAAGTPSTSFQTIQNPGDKRDGSMLMVEAYAVIWTVLLIWLLSMWSKQRGINARLDALESALDRAEAKAKTKKDAA